MEVETRPNAGPYFNVGRRCHFWIILLAFRTTFGFMSRPLLPTGELAIKGGNAEESWQFP